eukprot:gb/GECH01012763.1/.p1 GENE.gb/GECH01012763.1/~~gb/GECH01012763.1/.p1  ORF type:complete len:156 (+),score=48.62 gb/GECH01012763.1/:1-468(+)
MSSLAKSLSNLTASFIIGFAATGASYLSLSRFVWKSNDVVGDEIQNISQIKTPHSYEKMLQQKEEQRINELKQRQAKADTRYIAEELEKKSTFESMLWLKGIRTWNSVFSSLRDEINLKSRFNERQVSQDVRNRITAECQERGYKAREINVTVED